MELKKASIHSLKSYLLYYLISIFLGAILVTMITLGLVSIGYRTDIIQSANAIENQILAQKKTIQESDHFDKTLLPKEVDFVYLSKDNKAIATNLAQKAFNADITKLRKKEPLGRKNRAYLTITQSNGNTLYVIYSIKASYTNQWLNDYLPNPDWLLIIAFIVNFSLVMYGLIYLFSKKLKEPINHLINITEQLKDKELMVSFKPTKITEFNQVIASMETLQLALKDSLYQQWTLENMRREEISALAHDIKTPLTIINGNAELLKETSIDAGQERRIEAIISNGERIASYVSQLVALNKMDKPQAYHFQDMALATFSENIEGDIKEYLKSQGARANYSIGSLEGEIRVDQEKIVRAVLNIVSNGLTYGDSKELAICHYQKDSYFYMIFKNQGSGFSSEALERGTEKFYQMDKSRSSSQRFGLGLFIVQNIVSEHKGLLELANHDSGAIVTIGLPLNIT